MKFFEVIVAVERPVCFQEIITRGGRIEHRTIERQKTDSLVQRFNPFRKRERRIKIAKQKRPPALERDARQIVLFTRKVRDAVEFRHRHKRTIERELATVITAAHSFDVPLAFNHDRAAMRADIRKTMRLHLLVDREQQRLVETTFEQRERPDVPGRFQLRGFADELPRMGKDLFLRTFVPDRIDIDLRGQRLRVRNVVSDLKGRFVVHRFRTFSQKKDRSGKQEILKSLNR